ncbi:MAG TPA: DUF4139 domain-containing protein [Oleiagrimonas sp.]|nr:DUF4139 domain-containing protein [Oleiagrimonas sp.]
MMTRTVLALALAATVAAPAWAASSDHPDLTIYRSGSSSLFSAASGHAVDAGHAVVHETRTLHVKSGTHDVVISDLPDFLDPEAVHLNFDSDDIQVLSQRLLLPRGQNGTLSGHIGKSVTVLGSNGEPLASGLLVRVNSNGSLVIGGDVFGPTVVRRYAAVKLTGGRVGGGARLQLRVKAGDSESTQATLTYPTAGIGWRAAYTGTLESGSRCRLRLEAKASIANRSGRDWENAEIKLVAGSPNFSKPSAPRPVMMKSMAAESSYARTPQQGTLGDYRTYTLPGAVNLPRGSVTLTPLYQPHTVSCERTWVFENGNTYHPSRPATNDNNGGTRRGPVISTLSFEAFDSFPAGYLRVLTVDDDGNAEFLGESHVGDTPKGQPVHMVLGTAFDLTGTRTRTSFNVNEAANTMSEGFTITLDNAGDSARTVTVREHPWRWRNWELTSSTQPPSKQTPDVLEFQVKVPAHGKATLDYSVRYSWTAADE